MTLIATVLTQIQSKMVFSLFNMGAVEKPNFGFEYWPGASIWDGPELKLLPDRGQTWSSHCFLLQARPSTAATAYPRLSPPQSCCHCLPQTKVRPRAIMTASPGLGWVLSQNCHCPCCLAGVRTAVGAKAAGTGTTAWPRPRAQSHSGFIPWVKARARVRAWGGQSPGGQVVRVRPPAPLPLPSLLQGIGNEFKMTVQ